MKDVQFLLTDSYFVACARSRVLFNAISEKLSSDLMTARKGNFYGEKWEKNLPEGFVFKEEPFNLMRLSGSRSGIRNFLKK